ncbi:MAG: S1 RNA-binding domain-containing protein [Sphingobacteriaceae bacterium]
MIDIGRYNHLKFIEKADTGIILSDGERSALLPYNYVKPDLAIGDMLDVFIYCQSDEQLMATTKTAFACAEEFAFLKVIDENDQGVFMDLGIDKDVFVHSREQHRPMENGEHYVVYVYADEHSGRLIGSSKLHNFIEEADIDIEAGDEVTLLISERTDMGYNAIINNKYIGLLYQNELFEEIHPGELRRGYVKKVREENKIDLSLQPIGYEHIINTKDALLKLLKENSGRLHLGDKSSPDEIYQQLKISKKAFKKATGGLYKERLITVSDHEIKLVPNGSEESD